MHALVLFIFCFIEFAERKKKENSFSVNEFDDII